LQDFREGFAVLNKILNWLFPLAILTLYAAAAAIDGPSTPRAAVATAGAVADLETPVYLALKEMK